MEQGGKGRGRPDSASSAMKALQISGARKLIVVTNAHAVSQSQRYTRINLDMNPPDPVRKPGRGETLKAIQEMLGYSDQDMEAVFYDHQARAIFVRSEMFARAAPAVMEKEIGAEGRKVTVRLGHTEADESMTAATFGHLNLALLLEAMRKQNNMIHVQAKRVFTGGPGTLALLNGSDLEVARGFSLTFPVCDKGVLMMLDATHKPFLDRKLGLEVWYKMLRDSWFPDKPQDLKDYVTKNIKGVDLTVNYYKSAKIVPPSHRPQRFKGLGVEWDKDARRFTFPYEDGSISIFDYLKKKYGVVLKEPTLPVVILQGRGPPDTYPRVPLECLNFSPWVERRIAMTVEERAEFITVARMAPSDRVNFTRDTVKTLSDTSHEKSVGLRFGAPERVEADILPAPKIMFGPRNKPTIVDVSASHWSMRNRLCFNTPPRPVNVMLAACGQTSQMEPKSVDITTTPFCAFLEMLSRLSGECGVPLAPVTHLHVIPDVLHSTHGKPMPPAMMLEIFKKFGTAPPELVIFILNGPNPDRYAAVVEGFDRAIGVPLQCVQLNKVEVGHSNPNESYCYNLVIQYLAKLGLAAWCLPPEFVQGVVYEWAKKLSNRILVLGCDVWHGHVQQSDKSDVAGQSVAAVVGTLDLSLTRNRTELRYLESDRNRLNREVLDSQEVRDCVLPIARDWASMNKVNGQIVPPDVVVFLRDGVGDGQYGLVQQQEIPGLRLALEEVFGASVNPRLEYLICQKRNNFRAATKHDPSAPQAAGRGAGRGRGGPGRDKPPGEWDNAPPGTLIMSHVVETERPNFFLQSHKPIEGSANFIHYVVLADDFKVPVHSLAKFVYGLCHIHMSTTRSVSIPNVAFLAHKAAKRAGQCYKSAYQEALKTTDPVIRARIGVNPKLLQKAYMH